MPPAKLIINRFHDVFFSVETKTISQGLYWANCYSWCYLLTRDAVIAMMKLHVFTTTPLCSLYPDDTIHTTVYLFMFTVGSEICQEQTVLSDATTYYDTPYHGETRQILTAHSKGRRRQSLDWEHQRIELKHFVCFTKILGLATVHFVNTRL